RGQSVVRGSGFYDFQSFGELNEVVVVGYGDAQVALRGTNSITSAGDGVLYVVDGEIKAAPPADIQPGDILSMKVLKGLEATTLYGAKAANGVVVITTRKAAEAQLQQVKARTDLRETAFFFPDLMTDAEGNVKISFQAPERLTQWKFMAFAHTKEMQTGYLELPVQTRKNLMVEPHVPRIVREGDEVVITAKVNNRSGSDVDGGVKLSLLDPYTMQPIDSLYNLSGSLQSFSVPKGGSTTAGWRLNIPEGGADWIVYRIA